MTQPILETQRNGVGMRWTVLLLCLIFATAVSRAANDDFIRLAVSQGVKANGCYLIENIESQKISQKKLFKMLGKQDYVAAEVTTNAKGHVQKAYFIAANDYYKYLYYTLGTMDGDASVEPLKGIGTAYFVYAKPVKRNFFDSKPIRYDDELDEGTQVYWSGDTDNGNIDGTGMGIYAIERRKYYFFKGTFVSGIPASEIVTKLYDCHLYDILNNVPFDKGKVVSETRVGASSKLIYSKFKSCKDNDMKRVYRRHQQVTNADLPAKYINEAKEIIRTNKTPVLSQTTMGSLNGVSQTIVFTGDPEAESKRCALEIMSQSNTKAAEALHYMNVLDGLFFASAEKSKQATDDITNGWTFAYIDNSNYWKQLEAAALSAQKLKTMPSAKSIKAKVVAAETKINNWGKKAYTMRQQSKDKSKKAFNKLIGDPFRKALNEALKSGGSGSSSSDDDDERYRSTVENLKMPDYKVESDWHDVISSAMNHGADQTKYIVFSDTQKEAKLGRRKSANGRWIYRVHSTNADYYTEEDAIIAAYAYQKYNLIRKKGEWD